jgi:nicotinamide mononucleotide transporter
MNPIEFFANLFNLLSVFLANRNSFHTWWTGIIGTILLGILFYEVKLYADVILQVFFILTGIWGWWNWRYGGRKKTELPITRVGWQQLFIFGILAVLLTIGHGSLLHTLTDASFPFIDSIILVCSIIAQFLLMKRKLESWYFWILVDSVAVPLYAAKELYLTSSIYSVFLILAIWGLLHWRRIWVSEQS